MLGLRVYSLLSNRRVTVSDWMNAVQSSRPRMTSAPRTGGEGALRLGAMHRHGCGAPVGVVHLGWPRMSRVAIDQTGAGTRSRAAAVYLWCPCKGGLGRVFGVAGGQPRAVRNPRLAGDSRGLQG